MHGSDLHLLIFQLRRLLRLSHLRMQLWQSPYFIREKTYEHFIFRFNQVLLIGMLSSLAIEIMQLFNWRVSDIDDLLMNTLGAVIGFFLFRLVDMIIHGIYSIFAHNKNSIVKSGSHRHALATAKSKTPNISEAIAYIILSYLGVFFLYNVTGISALVERFE